MTDESESQQLLEKLIRQKTNSPAQQFLQERARLLLAARALRDADIASARLLLGAISHTSPVAMDAGLLLAHSYRLEQNDGEALQWFLRVIYRYPEYPNALRGLLRAGDDLMMDDQVAMANRLFNESSDRALTMLRYLDTLPTDPMARADLIFQQGLPDKKTLSQKADKSDSSLKENNSLPAALRQQLIKKMLEQASETIPMQQAERHYRQQWRCLLQQQARFEQQRNVVSADIDRIDTALQQSEQAQSSLAAEITDLSSRLVSNDWSESQRRIRQRLTQARNQQTVLQAQRDFLQQSRNSLPIMLARTERQLTLLTELYASLRDQADMSLQRDIDQAVQALRIEFSNIAAESEWRLAELQSGRY